MDTKTEDLGAAPTNYKLPAFADAADPVGVENAPSLDDYELIGTIGRGGMGVVYEARQISLNRLVAIKMLSANLPLEGEFILRFQMEAEAAASIDHPNIVPIYEVGEEDGQPFIVMKLIEGQSLAESSQLLLGDRRAAELMVTISRAVDAAHRAGILHRDLKPGNILIEKESGEPHVADFGLAKRIGVGEEFGLTLSGQVLGTPGFMAPEQASGSSLTTAADIYSLGAILYQLLTGKPPFSGKTAAQVLRQVEEERPARPSSTIRVDRDLEAITMRCLERDPKHRYASASDLADDLERWLRGEPVMARWISGAGRLARWIKRKPALAAAWIVGILFVLTLAIAGPIVAISQAKLRSAADAASEDVRRGADLLSHRLYASEMTQASLAINEANGLSQAAEALKNWVPAEGEADIRGWEWFHLTLSADRGIVPAQEFRGVGSVFDLHKDGLFTGAFGSTLRFANSANGETLWKREFPDQARPMKALISDDGRFVAAVTAATFEVVLLSAEDGAELERWPSVPESSWIAWSRAGALLAFHHLEDNSIRVWDAENSAELNRFDGTPETRARFFDWLPDGSGLMIGNNPDGAFFRLHVGNDEPVLQLPVTPGPKFQISSLSIAPDGTRTAVGDVIGRIHILDLATNRFSPPIKAHTSHTSGLAWSPDGKHLASIGEDIAIQVWNTESRANVGSFRGHPGKIQGVIWPSPDEFYTWSGNVAVWRPFDDDTIRSSRAQALPGLGWSADGRLAAGNGELVLLDGDSTSFHDLHGGSAADFSWTPDGKRIASFSNGTIVISEPGNPDEAVRLDHHAGADVQLEICADRPWICSLSEGELVVSNYETGELIGRHELGLANRIRAHPINAEVIFSGNWASEIRALNLESGKIRSVCRPARNRVRAFNFDSTGQLLATGSTLGQVELWRYPSGEPIHQMRGHTSKLTDVAFSPDSKRLASASEDTTIRIWDVETGAQVAILKGHPSSVLRVAWSPDGKTLASTGQAGEVRLWKSE